MREPPAHHDYSAAAFPRRGRRCLLFARAVRIGRIAEAEKFVPLRLAENRPVAIVTGFHRPGMR